MPIKRRTLFDLRSLNNLHGQTTHRFCACVADDVGGTSSFFDPAVILVMIRITAAAPKNNAPRIVKATANVGATIMLNTSPNRPPQMTATLMRVATLAPDQRVKTPAVPLFSRRAMDQPTEPSKEIATNCCASMANSIGKACKTSLQNPLTTRATASSSSMPRERQ